MKKYVVFVAYSLKGNGYTEVPNGLKSTHKLFNTPEEAVAAILHDIEVEYHNDGDYKDFEITPPQIKTFADGHKWVSAGVLILIVVEDGLVLFRELLLWARSLRLNPYCSGRWSRTY